MCKRIRRLGAWTLAILGLSVMASLFLLASVALAAFGGSKSVPGNPASVGRVDLGVTPASGLLNLSEALPGDSVAAPLTITNTGSKPITYTVQSVTTDNVVSAIFDLGVKSGVADCSVAGYDASGTGLYSGVYGTTSGTTLTPIARTLAAGASEALCFRLTLPTTAPDGYQGASTSATFYVAYTQ